MQLSIFFIFSPSICSQINIMFYVSRFKITNTIILMECKMNLSNIDIQLRIFPQLADFLEDDERESGPS